MPDISVKVQPLGLGECQVKSPVTWATITLYWSKSGGIIQTWTLTGASVVFSNDVHGEFNFTVQIKIQGYRSFGDSTPTTDIVKGTFSTNSGISAGAVYRLTLNASPNYAVSPFFNLPEPEIVNAIGTVAGGTALCPGEISLVSEGIGTGSTSYSPPPLNVSEIRITVNNTGNPELRNYVINFTVSPSCIPDLSKVYVTDSSGKQLYFWAFNDSTNGKIWFWVNYTVPANSVREIMIHLNGTGTSQYFNPNRVFWYFNDITLSIQGGLLSGNIYVLDYPVSNFLNAGYDGYAVDTNATLGKPSLGSIVLPTWLGPYFISVVDDAGYYYGLGATGNDSIYVVEGSAPDRVNNGGAPVGTLPSWGPGVYSIVNYIYNAGVHTRLYFELSEFIAGYWTGSQTLARYFMLGQRYGGPSVYEWVGVRPIAYPAPRVIVPSDCGASIGGGEYTFTLYFRP
ncbi:DUF2341 domain-containing protein [Thermococcus sp.]|uniref:DUF2341 domain-containing protein n=1 Tax=Thermococcus sp. TaxID=35749 RepID=UPI002622F8A0|nr:DUF2341 domain-containing protein [Thermococcus sp.]